MKAPTKARTIFIEFMKRDGFDAAAAAHEFDEFLTINGKARVKASYLTVRRTGAKIATNRTGRAAIFMTFENALNHSTFAA